MWRVFLSMMEEYVPFLGCPLFDCTEGGALIRGTTVMPLREWMDRLASMEPFDVSPAEAAFRGGFDPSERAGRASGVASRIEEGLRRMDGASEALDGIEKRVGRVSTPALSPSRRQGLADEVYRALDAFHREYPVMDYMGQGLSGANALKILHNRQMLDVPATKAWAAALQNLVAAYRVSLHFIKTWLRYISAAAGQWDGERSLAPLPFYPAGSVRDLNGLEDALGVEKIAEALASSDDRPFGLDNLLARADHKWWHFWDDRVDWRVARFLQGWGRFAEASFFMARFERTELQIFGLPEDQRRNFYRDYARILASRDLCRETDWDEVFLLLEKASASEDLAESLTREKERDSKLKTRALDSARGTLFFDYAPQYVVEELSRLVENVTRLAAVALYHKERVLDFSPNGGCPTNR
jgi:hypothetical protein